MNFKCRIKRIENKLFPENNGLNFQELLKSDFVYKRKPFNDVDEMYRKLNIVEIPPYLTDIEEIVLLEKRLISVSSIFAQELREKTSEEMLKKM